MIRDYINNSIFFLLKIKIPFKQGLKLEPNNVNALEEMGYILSLLGRQEEALVYYEKALTINPNFRVRANIEKVICERHRQHLESLLSQS